MLAKIFLWEKFGNVQNNLLKIPLCPSTPPPPRASSGIAVQTPKSIFWSYFAIYAFFRKELETKVVRLEILYSSIYIIPRFHSYDFLKWYPYEMRWYVITPLTVADHTGLWEGWHLHITITWALVRMVQITELLRRAAGANSNPLYLLYQKMIQIKDVQNEIFYTQKTIFWWIWTAVPQEAPGGTEWYLQ